MTAFDAWAGLALPGWRRSISGCNGVNEWTRGDFHCHAASLPEESKDTFIMSNSSEKSYQVDQLQVRRFRRAGRYGGGGG